MHAYIPSIVLLYMLPLPIACYLTNNNEQPCMVVLASAAAIGLFLRSGTTDYTRERGDKEAGELADVSCATLSKNKELHMHVRSHTTGTFFMLFFFRSRLSAFFIKQKRVLLQVEGTVTPWLPLPSAHQMTRGFDYMIKHFAT
jgi:hypothetical protein